jgi:hypothetical protein
MGEIQIPFGAVSSAAADLADRENDLVNYFLAIDTQPIATVVARTFGGRGPRGYGVSLVLSRILKVKQVFISDVNTGSVCPLISEIKRPLNSG